MLAHGGASLVEELQALLGDPTIAVVPRGYVRDAADISLNTLFTRTEGARLGKILFQSFGIIVTHHQRPLFVEEAIAGLPDGAGLESARRRQGAAPVCLAEAGRLVAGPPPVIQWNVGSS